MENLYYMCTVHTYTHTHTTHVVTFVHRPLLHTHKHTHNYTQTHIHTFTSKDTHTCLHPDTHVHTHKLDEMINCCKEGGSCTTRLY